jgi:hypothetical protein
MDRMSRLLWIVQVFLALAFFAHGLILLFPPASMLEQMSMMPTWFRMFLGAAEVVAAVGLTLPGMTGIQPWWTQWAAAGIMVVMISACVLHITRGEVGPAVTTAFLFVLATFVAYGRWKVKPIRSAL